jgi:hypothetical protein
MYFGYFNRNLFTIRITGLQLELRGGQNRITLDILELGGEVETSNETSTKNGITRKIHLPFNHYWGFFDCNSTLIELHEIELLIGEDVLIDQSIKNYYGKRINDLNKGFIINALKTKKDLRLENASHLLPFQAILGYAVFNNGKDKYIHIHTKTRIESIEYFTFLKISGLKEVDLPLLTKPCLSYIRIYSYKAYGSVQWARSDLQESYFSLKECRNVEGFMLRITYTSFQAFQDEQSDLEWEDRMSNADYDDIDIIRDVFEGDPDNIWNVD